MEAVLLGFFFFAIALALLLQLLLLPPLLGFFAAGFFATGFFAAGFFLTGFPPDFEVSLEADAASCWLQLVR